MSSLAEILESLGERDPPPAHLAAALDDLIADVNFDPDLTLSELAEFERSGRVSGDTGTLIRDRIQNARAAGLSGETVFQPTPPGPGVMAEAAAAPGEAGDATQIAPPPPETGLRKGDVINGRFVLEELLGTGGMGSVFKAMDQRKLEAQDRNPYVAIKLLNADFRARPDSMMTLQREARRAQGLAHPNIVRVYDFDRDDRNIYLTMEYLVGSPLDKMIRASDYAGAPVEEGLALINQIGEALSFAHEHGVAHCDLKPGNIFLTERGQIKVIDFGISRPVKTGDEHEADVTRFDPGSIGALTPAYASPELIEDNEAGPASDIFAFACIACEILSGKHPFDRIEATKARDRGLEPTLPDSLSRIQAGALRQALAFDPKARTATVRELLDGLNATQKSGRGGMVAIAALGAVLLAMIGGATYYYVTEIEPGAEQQQTVTGTTAPPAAQPREAGAAGGRAIVGEADLERQLGGAGQSPQSPASAPPQVAARPPDPISERLEEIFARLDCAQLLPTVQGGTVRLAGYMPPSQVAALRTRVLGIEGVRDVAINTHPITESQCALARMITPFANRNRASRSGLSIRMRAPNGEYRENDKLIVDFRAPVRESYIYVDYFSLDGGVVHMLPNPKFADRTVSANLTKALGENPGEVQWTVGAPFGVEMIVAIATPEPLFSGARPEVEKAADYIAALRQGLGNLVRKEGIEPVVADLVFLKTSPK